MDIGQQTYVGSTYTRRSTRSNGRNVTGKWRNMFRSQLCCDFLARLTDKESVTRGQNLRGHFFNAGFTFSQCFHVSRRKRGRLAMRRLDLEHFQSPFESRTIHFRHVTSSSAMMSIFIYSLTSTSSAFSPLSDSGVILENPACEHETSPTFRGAIGDVPWEIQGASGTQ